MRDKWYINAEFTIMPPGYFGGSLHPKLRWDPLDLSQEAETEVLHQTDTMIRETFTAARRLHAIQAEQTSDLIESLIRRDPETEDEYECGHPIGLNEPHPHHGD